MSFDRNTAIRAGVKAKHVARLLGVSRFTANNWLSGRRQPHDLIHRRVDLFEEALKEAIAAGELPITDDDMLPEERSVELMRILRTHMEKLRES